MERIVVPRVACPTPLTSFSERPSVSETNESQVQSGSNIGGFGRDLNSPADSRPSHRFRSSAEAYTRPPSRVTGNPGFAHRSAADIGRSVANRFHIVASKPVSHPLTE
jgi:hypothetical protein